MSEARLTHASELASSSQDRVQWQLSQGGIPSDKRRYWKTALAGAGVTGELRVRDWMAFKAVRTERKLGDKRLTLVEYSAAELRVGPSNALRTRPLLFVLVLAGRLRLIYEGVLHTVTADQMLVIDTSREHRLQLPDGYRALTLEMASTTLAQLLTAGADGGAVVLEPESLAGLMASQLIRQAWRSPSISAELGERVSEQLARVVAEGLARSRSRSAPLTSHKIAMIRRARTLALKNVHDHRFDATALADSMGITGKHLSQLFSHLTLSPAAYLRRLRLHRAWDLLTDTDKFLSISAIAEQSGMPDPSSFARLVKKTYGSSPSEIRQTLWS